MDRKKCSVVDWVGGDTSIQPADAGHDAAEKALTILSDILTSEQMLPVQSRYDHPHHASIRSKDEKIVIKRQHPVPIHTHSK
jgi:hypothetical protein